MSDGNTTLLDYASGLGPTVLTAVAAVVAWFTAGWRARKVAEAKTAEVIETLRAKAHHTELELAQIRAVLAAATGVKIDQITLDMIQAMVHRERVTLQELETFVLTMPRLMWIKRREGPGRYRMMQVSQVYADKYLGGCAASYTDKTDTELWPADVAAEFSANDEAAFNSGAVVEVDELVYSPRTGVRGRFVGVKWSFGLGKDTYVCGLGTHDNEVEP